MRSCTPPTGTSDADSTSTEVLDHLGEVIDAPVDVVRRDSIDVVAIAGDVFDRAAPSAESFACSSDLAGAACAAEPRSC